MRGAGGWRLGGMGRGDAAELRGAAMAGAVRAIAGAFVRRRDMGGRARGRDGIARANEADDVGRRSRIGQETGGFLGIPPSRMDVEGLHGHKHFRLLRIVGEER